LSDWVVEIRHGLSVPRALIPDARAVVEEAIAAGKEVDWPLPPLKPWDFYNDETGSGRGGEEDVMGAIIRDMWEGQVDLVLLDSAGHMGFVEFNYLLTLLRKPCIVALDDIRHVKHWKSYAFIVADPRFEVLEVGDERHGHVIARFTPTEEHGTGTIEDGEGAAGGTGEVAASTGATAE
jgi:hypothetical protein